MLRRTSIVAATMFTAALSLTACNGSDTKAAATSPSSVATSSSSTSAPSSTSSTTSTTTAAASSTSATSSSVVTKTVQASPSTKSVSPKTTTAAAPAVQMGGKCGTTASGYTIYADSNVACDFALRVGAKVHGGAPMTVTAYSSKMKTDLTVSCFTGSVGNVVCETPSGSLITASVRG